MKTVKAIERRVTSFLMTVCMMMVIYSATFFATPKKPETLFLQNAKTPPCAENINDLPISLVYTTLADGSIFRGTAFMVGMTEWVTAAHVVDGDVIDVSIVLDDTILLGNITYIGDSDNDIAVIQTSATHDYTPLVVGGESELPHFAEVWNIGYPAWAGRTQVVTSGSVIGTGTTTLFTSAMVMGGMSGGPTLYCNGDQLQVDGVIKSYRKELTSENVSIINGIHTIEKSYVNTGEGFSTLLSSILHPPFILQH